MYFMATRVCPAFAVKYKIYSMAPVGSTNFKITQMAGYAKEIDVVDESDEGVLQEKNAQNTKKSTKFAIKAFRHHFTKYFAESPERRVYK